MKSKKRFKIAAGIVLLSTFFLLVLYLFLDDEKLTLDERTRSKLDGSFINLVDGVVHYEIAGPNNRPVVVLIHGFSVPYYVWDPSYDALVESGYRVLRYDLYGRGYSDRPDKDYNLDLYIQQLQQLLSALSITGKIHIVGLSYGGPIATAYTNRFPDQVHSLILIDPVSSPVTTKEIFPMNIPLVGEYVVGVYLAPFMLPNEQVKDFYQPERFPNWERAYREQMKYKGFKRAILSSIRNMVDIDPPAEYQAVGTLKVPVLLIWGKEDETISSSEINNIRQYIPGVEFHAIDKGGHLPHYERPEIVNKLLVNFIIDSIQ